MCMRVFASVALLLLLGALALQPAHAAEPEVCTSGSPIDGDRDGQPEALRLSCAYATERDTITIYPRAGALDPGADWRRVLDTEQALWVFDAGSDGSVNLIIEFRREGPALVAELYDDLNDDGRVSFELQGGQPTITERALRMARAAWSVRVTAPDGWWVKDGRVNFNLSIAVDGPVRATFGPDITYSKMVLDGQPDVAVDVTDPDHNGVPDTDVRRLLMELPSLDGYYRSNIMVNEGGQDVPIENSIVWPYLGSTFAALRGYNPTVTEVFRGRGGRSYGIVRDYHENPAPLQVEWERSKIQYIGEFVPSRGGEQQWFVYSLAATPPGTVSTTNFESPFAFYDLANDRDGIPELSVRHVGYAPEDPFYANGLVKHGVRIVRYSWDQDNNQSWDYKLGLISRSPLITDTVTVGATTLNVLPYDRLAQFSVEQPADAVTFVAQETPNAWTSEGIYQWDDSPNLSSHYLAGIGTRMPNDDFGAIAAGFRGEINLDYHQPPQLYFSPIDRKLHLLGAERGIWNSGTKGELRVRDTDRDGYLDQWTHTQVLTTTEMITREQQLNISRSHLIYASANGIVLRQAAVPLTSWTVAPPATHAEWQQLGTALEREGPAPAPGDLQAMIAPFRGPEQRISGATVRDYRATGEQFRFVLDLQPGFTVTGAALLPRGDLAPGSYVVSYDGELRVTPLTPPALSATLADAPLTELEPNLLKLTLRNAGLADVTDGLVEVWAQPPGGAATVVTSDTVSVLGQEQITLKLSWTPRRAGTWTLTPTLRQGDQPPLSLQAAQQIVQPLPPTDAGRVIGTSTTAGMRPALVTGLALFALVAALIVWQQWARYDREVESCS